MQSQVFRTRLGGDILAPEMHNAIRVTGFQKAPDPTSFESLTEGLLTLGWIDKAALGVLLAFFVLGLFKGLVWQVSRIGILVFSYMVAGRFGHEIAGFLDDGESLPPAGDGADAAAIAATNGPVESSVYLAYCLIFITMLVILSLLSILLKQFIVKAGLGFFDRLGGGVFGVATGAVVVLFGVLVLHMFSAPNGDLVRAAQKSHAMDFSRRAIAVLGGAVDDNLRRKLSLAPLKADPPPDPASPAMSDDG